MKAVSRYPTVLLALVFVLVCHGSAGEETALRILRPLVEGQQVSPTWTEVYYIVIDARHPDGVEKLQLVQEGAKQAERSFSEKDRHESGYFLYKRRMKSASTRDYVIKMWPVGSDPESDDPILSEKRFPLQYLDPKPELTDHLSFVNLSDGEVIAANNPGDPDDITYVIVDCQDSSGHWGESQPKENRHVGYRDDDGIEWVELVIAGPKGDERVIRNESALILDKDHEYHGPYWGEPVNPDHAKSPDEPWPDGVEWQPIEGFGLYQFKISLAAGKHQLRLRVGTREDEIVEGPAIEVEAR